MGVEMESLPADSRANGTNITDAMGRCLTRSAKVQDVYGLLEYEHVLLQDQCNVQESRQRRTGAQHAARETEDLEQDPAT